MLQVMKNIDRYLLHERTVCERFAQLKTGTSNAGIVCFHLCRSHLAEISCFVGGKIDFPDHSSRNEFYNNRSALFLIFKILYFASNV